MSTQASVEFQKQKPDTTGSAGPALFCLMASLSAGLLIAAVALAVSTSAAESASRKLDRITRPEPPATPVSLRFTEEEVNSYLYYNLARQYPPGVSRVNVSFSPGAISGSAEIDFDKLKAARAAGGPSYGRGPRILNYLFSGTHTIASDGNFSAADGMGRFELNTVSIDGIPLPQPMVDYLIENYLRDHFPGFDLEKPFALPYAIDRMQVSAQNLDVTTRPAPSR